MNVSEYMKKHGITDEKLDAIAAPYESGDYASEDGKVYTGSHTDSVGKRRVTVVYNAAGHATCRFHSPQQRCQASSDISRGA